MRVRFSCCGPFILGTLGTTVLMGEIVGLHDVQCCAEDADKDTVYETLKKGRKEESHYAHIISLTDKPADDNLPPKALSDGKSFYLLKILYIVLTIVIIVSTATTIALIHELMQRTDATDQFLDTRLAEIKAIYKGHETKLSELQLDLLVANYSLKFLDTRLESIQDGLNCSCENWGPFSACSVSCGHGMQIRTRKCRSTSIFFSRVWCARNEIDIQPCIVNCQAPDCQYILQLGQPTSGVYIIILGKTGKKVYVYCDIDFEGVGWTVIQKRYDGSIDFYRNWTEYKEGFGDPHGEYWIGNEVIHNLSSEGNYTLKIILTDWNDTTKIAVYNKFYVNGEDDKYRLTIDGYSGDAGHAMRYHNGRLFSAFDNDNDRHDGNCAVKHHGAWWYTYFCDNYTYAYSNLNGLYYNGSTLPYGLGIIWYPWLGNPYSLKATEMMIKKT